MDLSNRKIIHCAFLPKFIPANIKIMASDISDDEIHILNLV
jgi:hypothetical protein